MVKPGSQLVKPTMPQDFKTFFSTAFTGKPEPYSYQDRLAHLPCESRMISVSTGLGKPAAAASSSILAAEKP